MLENNYNESKLDAKLNDEGLNNLKSVAQFAYYNAIIGFIALAVSTYSSITTALKAPTGFGSSMVGLFIGIGISLLLNITLFNASVNIKRGIESKEQGLFDFGLSKLGSYFMIFGILAIIGIAIMLLVMLITMAAISSR